MRIRCSAGYGIVRDFLSPFPCGLLQEEEDAFVITRGPTELLWEILQKAQILPTGVVSQKFPRPCMCKTKHAVVPAHSHNAWAEALRGTPLAPALAAQTRFLGARLCSRTRAHEQPRNMWTQVALRVCRQMTWEKAVRMCQQRSRSALEAGLSLELRTESWNTYCASTLPYPASTILPGPEQLEALRGCVATLFPTGTWARRNLPSGIHMALGIAHGPRDPEAVAITSSVTKVVFDQFAGPPDALREPLDWTLQLQEWARVVEEPCPLNCGLHGMSTLPSVLRARRTVRGGLIHPLAVSKQQLVRAIYIGVWWILDQGATKKYLLKRSRSRRWAPSEGQEWVQLSKCERWSQAWLITRLLLDGLPGTASRRPSHLRGPVRCWNCGIIALPQWRWLSPSENPGNPSQEGRNGVAWCTRCCQVSLPALVPGSPPGPGGYTALNRLGGPPAPQQGAYTTCPLCGLGEAGSEHLVIFCPAVAEAWRILCPSSGHWWLGWHNAPVVTPSCGNYRLPFAHAVAFLACAIGNAPVQNPEAGCRLIMQQVLGRRHPGVVPSPAEDSTGMPPIGNFASLDERLNTWEVLGQVDQTTNSCDQCGLGQQHHARTWHGKHPHRSAAASAVPARAILVAAQDIGDGQNILTFRAPSIPAAWPFMIGGPFGYPLSDTLQANNFIWQSARCQGCHSWLISMQACRPIRCNDALCGDPPPHTISLPKQADSDYQVSFDGGARHRSINSVLDSQGPRAVGAGAALWGPSGDNGRRACIAQITVSDPRRSCSMLAEALGLRAAIALALLTLKQPQSITIIGDNLPVLRMAAANGRVKTPGVWELLEGPLLHTSVQGWDCQWVAVRRHLNIIADKLATLGTYEAVDRAAQNNHAPTIALWTQDGASTGIQEIPWFPRWAVQTASNPLIDTQLP